MIKQSTSPTPSSSSSPPTIVKVKTVACHHCRTNHISCSGQRPCTRCVQKGKECFEYNKALHALKPPKPRKKRSKVNKSSSVVVVSTTTDQHSAILEELRRKEQELEYYRQQNAFLENQLREVKLKPQNEFIIDLWNPPVAMQYPIIIVEASTLKLVGSNPAFYELIGQHAEHLKSNRFTYRDVFPERYSTQWSTMSGWILSSCYKLFESRTFIKNATSGNEICCRMASHFHNSYIWIEIEPNNEYNDEYIIDDLVIPATFRVPATAVPKDQVVPLETFAKLLDVFSKNTQKLSKYSDTQTSQRQTMEELQNIILYYYLNSSQPMPAYLGTREYQPSTGPVFEEVLHEDNPLGSDLLEILDQYEQDHFNLEPNNTFSLL